MTEQNIDEGDQVSWNWGSGKPSGEVSEVAKEGEIAIESHKGNIIKKKAEPENPAVHVAREGNDVVKKASELQVEEKSAENANGAGKPGKGVHSGQDRAADASGPEKKAESASKENGEPKAGKKRDRDEAGANHKAGNGDDASKVGPDDDGVAGVPAAKKQKKLEEEPKKGRGRPKKSEANGAPKEKKSPAKKREPKKPATADGQPRRSSRLKA